MLKILEPIVMFIVFVVGVLALVDLFHPVAATFISIVWLVVCAWSALTWYEHLGGDV